MFRRRHGPVCLLPVALMLIAACGGGASAGSPGRALKVVAGENFWGSIAHQLVGEHGKVQSAGTDPNADPHQYESSPNDARAFADADVVILHGAGYDDWG